MEELKPCPFCGGRAEITNEDCYGYTSDETLVCCVACNLQLGLGNQYDLEEAIEAWNRRSCECANNAAMTPGEAASGR